VIKISYGQMKSPMFRNGIGKLTNTPHKDPKVAYSLAKLAKKLDEENKMHDTIVAPYQAERDANVEKWAEKDENGQMIAHPGQGGRPGYKIKPEHEDEWQEYLKVLSEKLIEVDKIEFELDRAKLKYPEDLGTVTLSPNEINGLEPVLELVEPVEAPAQA